MQLIFERPRGRFKSNCNILALAWTPHYSEQFDQHQRQWPPLLATGSNTGRMEDFGWLAIGNIGKLIGVTLTSLVPPPKEIDGRRESQQDLILLDDHTNDEVDDFEKIRPDRKSMRSNHNLRGHRDEIILVQWNEYYQKLATVDSKGNVLIWCKSNEKFTIQTPFYNRSKSVADFKWSNDGKTALICYTDSFILVGGSSGQRHWHSMLNLDDYHITCASWTPNDEQLLLGVSNGNVVLIDLPHSELTEMIVGQANIRTMSWSSSHVNLRHLDCVQPPAPRGHETANQLQSNSAIVNRRRLSLHCALFCRHCPSTTQGAHNRDCTRRPDQQQRNHADGGQHCAPERPGPFASGATTTPAHKDILAIDFANNTIKLFDGGLGDTKPREIRVGMESYLMAWSSRGEILAVAGFNISTSAPSVGYLRCKYSNAIKFYTQHGQLIYEYKLNFTRYPITALTWAHNDQRLFVATGPRLHCARVIHGIPSLSLLALTCLHRHTKTMDKADVLRGLLQKQLVPSVLSWQSFNCPLDLTEGRSAGSQGARLKQQQQSDSARGSDMSGGGGGPILAASTATDTESGGSGQEGRTLAAERAALENNINVARFHLPAKLKAKIDQLFVPTLRQPYDEQLTLSDIIWHVPKSQQRHYCTLICYTHELPDIGAIGLQYNQGPIGAQCEGAIEPESQANDQYKIFILYVEYQGSLIPVLKARRIGFLKPEFVIFDPERTPDPRQLQRHCKVSDVTSAQTRGSGASGCGRQVSRESRSSLAATNPNNQTRQPLMHESPQANCDELHNPAGSDYFGSRWSRSPMSARQSRDHAEPPKPVRPMSKSFYARLHATKRCSRKDSSSTAEQAIESYRLLSQAVDSAKLKTLPETRELVRIQSNIWGTKFKLVNVGNRMIGPRALLGSVVYKASILHLQPRQIFLNIKDMSNYCVLCSMHHHTELAPHARRARHWASGPAERPPRRSTSVSRTRNDLVSLIDLPVSKVDYLATPARTSSERNFSSSHHRHRQRAPPGHDRPTRCTTGAQLDGDKVILPVGDNIRVAPKLEPNQRYQFAGDVAPPHQSSALSLPRTTHSVESTPRRHRRLARCRRRPGNSSTSAVLLDPSRPTEPSASTSSACHDAAADMPTVDNNDILTLSLDQGDQVRVEMSSLSEQARNHLSHAGIEAPADPTSQKMHEFMQANKTLKSIQTITKMIVDLSSRAQGDEESTSPIPSGSRENSHPLNGDGDDDGQQSSPAKMFKASEDYYKHHHYHRQTRHKSHSRQYIPPDTPVHRPYKPAAAAARFVQGSQPAGVSQSVTNTPLKMATTNRRQRRGNSQTTSGRLSFDSECPLPSPPPSIPFRRKLSTSAKRFFDGSLRSLTGIGSAGPGGGYTTSEDFDSEDCEALVGNPGHGHRRRRKRAPGGAAAARARHQSQPCSPMRHGFADAPKQDRTNSWFSRASNGNRQRQSTLDLSQLRAQVVHKLRQTTGWLSASSDKLEIDVGEPGQSCTKRSRWVHKSGSAAFSGAGGHRQTEPFGYTESTAAGSSSSPGSSSSSDSSSTSSDESLDFNSSDEDEKKAMSFVNQALAQTRWFKRTSNGHSASARDLDEVGRVEFDGPVAHHSRSQRPEDDGRKRAPNQPRRRRRARKSICQNSKCCCSRDIKLSNRPPIWNEYSQVYQLDFGGRVTQESAKNLQIDFNGNLALQFGRVDKCTYTLDYKYPFNAVQAMSIALASLTQRLK